MKRINCHWIVIIIILFILLMLSSCRQDQKNDMSSLLKRPFYLNPAYKVGDRDFYHIKTTYLDMDDYGKVAQTLVLDGYYSREIKRVEQGRRTDCFVWKYVKKGSRKGKGEISKYRILPFTKDFQYEFEEWTPQRFPVDLSLIPKTMEGWRFVVKLIDAHTFDVIVSLDNYEGRIVHVGDSASLPGEGIPISMDFPPLFTDTYFKNAPFHTTFRGITLYRDEPCAILAFRSDDCEVHMVANINNMKLPTDGVSYYLGEVFLSLEARKVVWGRIIERVDSVTSLLKLGAPIKHVTRREIILERMDKEDYEQVNG